MQTVKNEVQEWISLIRQYKDIETLDREMLLRLIDRIEVGEVHIEDGQKVRDIIVLREKLRLFIKSHLKKFMVLLKTPLKKFALSRMLEITTRQGGKNHAEKED